MKLEMLARADAARQSQCQSAVSLCELTPRAGRAKRPEWLFPHSGPFVAIRSGVHPGINPRFIVTNIPESSADANALYDGFSCKRGEAENRINEAQLDLFGTRASCHRFIANQFRLLLSALAYTLMQAMKRHALHGTELARATSATIRCRLLKMGTSIMKNTRRIVLMLATNHPLRELFALAANRLSSNTPTSACALP